MLPQGYADELWSLTPYRSMFFLVGGDSGTEMENILAEDGDLFFFFEFHIYIIHIMW